MKKVFFNTVRSGYSVCSCGETCTLSELIDYLQDIQDNYGGEIPVYFCNDNGYTYGNINLNGWNDFSGSVKIDLDIDNDIDDD